MSTKSIALVAGTPYPLHMSGEYFRILDSTGAIDVDFRRQNRAIQDEVEGVLAGFALALPAGEGFDYIELLSATSQTVQIFAGSSRVEYDRAAGTVSVTGTVNVTQASATGATGVAAVTVGTSSVTARSANTALKRVMVRSRDSNTGSIWLNHGAAATVLCPVKLAPGEMWEEDIAPGLGIYAISDVAAQTIDVNGLT